MPLDDLMADLEQFADTAVQEISTSSNKVVEGEGTVLNNVPNLDDNERGKRQLTEILSNFENKSDQAVRQSANKLKELAASVLQKAQTEYEQGKISKSQLQSIKEKCASMLVSAGKKMKEFCEKARPMVVEVVKSILHFLGKVFLASVIAVVAVSVGLITSGAIISLLSVASAGGALVITAGLATVTGVFLLACCVVGGIVAYAGGSKANGAWLDFGSAMIKTG